ncbi:MAG: type VI secretion system baseplate subunit TssG [Pirellulales bacterium]|nr:type VI secretion system baseplate subunit TssG [Pirellulales bacterium]
MEVLAKEAYRFDFFQAVRLLGLLARVEMGKVTRKRLPVGFDHPPQDEIVRFRGIPSTNFPASDIFAFERLADESEADEPPQMTVNFMGLYGPAGVLPRHLIQSICDQGGFAKNKSLLDFLDIFHHRVISFFYRAWEKHRFPIVFERTNSGPESDATDEITEYLFCSIGMGTPNLRRRLDIRDQSILFYGGQYGHFPRCAISLESILSNYFGLPCTVKQYHGEWLYLSTAEQTAMPGPRHPVGLNNRLGYTAIVGERVWSVECKFRIRIGPVSYHQFRELMPIGSQLVPLAQLTRLYVGPALDFDFQVVLLGKEVPRCLLGAASVGDGAFLGMNTWLYTEPPSCDVEDAVFCHSGSPSR